MADIENIADSGSDNSADSGSESEFEGFEEDEVAVNGNILNHTVILNPNYDRIIARDEELNWSNIDTPPTIAPFTRDVGLTVDLDEEAEPIQFFKLFFNEDYWPIIVTETNKYAEAKIAQQPLSPNSRLHEWTPVTVDEVKLFFALCILMGVVYKESIEDYWTTNESTMTPFFNKKMSRNRFLAILSNLHLSDSTREIPVGQDGHDPLYKLRSFVNMCSRNFCDIYVPQKELSVDESTCPWKGRLRFRVYNPAKPDRFGIKLYSVNEANSGYCVGFDVYVGSTPVAEYSELVDLDQDSGQTTKIVIGLLAKTGLLHGGHHVYMDNYYTSPELFDELSIRETYACGTVRKNRKEFPEALKVKQRMLQGDSIFRRREDLLALKFYDKREVHMLSTIHTATNAIFDKRDQNGQPKFKPSCIADYCKFMGGVDLSDQNMKYYSVMRKSHKWWKKLFFFFFNMILTNSYALYRKYGTNKNLKSQDFREQIAISLILEAPEAPKPKPARKRPLTNSDRLTGRHFPAYNVAKEGAKRKHPARDCVACNPSFKNRGPRATKYKRNSTAFHCPDCNVALCVPRCFEVYHTYQNYKQVLNGNENSDSE
ncbi:MAG: transposase [Candidatus Thiodiazotropha taylori]|nr:transposase [Candidatus Thiodiazotropha taylori]MCG8113684.1 transposase [Candidatus Thiodiazotropha taylori]MCW4264189.1 transposase [Candidatus Thiodiazotropha endolucinida]MCW4286044.1 transposase [Candidatus Thiodiazotropha taylori]